MSYGSRLEIVESFYKELLFEYELNKKPFIYPEILVKQMQFEYKSRMRPRPYIPDAMFATEHGVHCYKFHALFRDSERCPYFYEQQCILFDDAKLYVPSVGPQIEDKDVIYDLKNLKLSIVTRPVKNLIALTDTIVICLDVNDRITGSVLEKNLIANGIYYRNPMLPQPSFPKYYSVCDIEQYYDDIYNCELFKEESIKSIILQIYDYDPYLTKLLSKAIKLGAIEAILERKDSELRGTWVDAIAKELNCSEDIANDAIVLLCKMFYRKWPF